MRVDRYIPPPGHPLRPYLQSIWRGRAKNSFRRETILPKGNVDIIFCMAEPPRLIAGKDVREPASLGACFVHGVQTTAVQTQPGNEFYLIGISLTMEACAALLRLPASELTDMFVEARLIFDNLETLQQRLFEAPNFRKHVRCCCIGCCVWCSGQRNIR